MWSARAPTTAREGACDLRPIESLRLGEVRFQADGFVARRFQAGMRRIEGIGFPEGGARFCGLTEAESEVRCEPSQPFFDEIRCLHPEASESPHVVSYFQSRLIPIRHQDETNRSLTPSLSHPMGEGVRRTGEGSFRST